MEKKIDLGINFLIEKNIKPLSADVLFNILVNDNYYGKDCLEAIFFNSKEMQELADATKRFSRCFIDNTKFAEADSIRPCSDNREEAYDILVGSYNAVVKFFTSGLAFYSQYDSYLIALILLSFAHACEGYFEESVVIDLLGFCSRQEIWF